jgi:predicted Zn finger-like uncharacterized protein
MILKCNSCDKKFVVPDSAITATGRMVQCGSCGNKWNQYPVKIETSKPIINKKINITKTSILTKNSKPKKKKAKKSREIDLYSPEYLEKKHGISLNNSKTSNNVASNKKAYFGFYNSFIVITILVIAFSRSLYFFQDFIVKSLPFSKFYLDYFFESINNIFEIIKNLISNY